MTGLGATLHAESVGLVGLLHRGVEGFPVRCFHLERDDPLDLLRLLGERQDIASMFAPEAPARG